MAVYQKLARKLSNINDDEIQSLMEKYGAPKKLHFRAKFMQFECNLIRSSQNKGSFMDATCFIRESIDNYIVIQKHQYANTGIYRAPSGGVKKGESIEAAAHREMLEETGLTIRLLRFVLDLTLDIVCEHEILPWRSIVFLAEPIGGDMKPIDTREIFDVTIMSRDNLLGDVDELMMKSGWGGFAYRAYINREFFNRIDELNI